MILQNVYGNLTSQAPANTGVNTYGWHGQSQRALDASGVILMGVRLYNSATVAFTSRDPIDGGNTTTYAYPQDPINQHDLDGQWLRLRWKKIGRAVLHAGIAIGVGALAVGACVGTAGVGCVIAASIAIGMPAHMIGGLAYDKATRTRVTGRSLQKDMSRPVTKGYSFYNKMKKKEARWKNREAKL